MEPRENTYDVNCETLAESEREAGILRSALAESERLRVEAEEKVAAYIKLVGQSSTQYRELVQALDAAKTVLSDIYKREGKSWHGSRVKADIESIMPAIGAALAKEGVGG
ncbi:MAG: hypothetical protein WC455_13735 [Dehalococcoidia bacterium]|jgi:hypothetical protein